MGAKRIKCGHNNENHKNCAARSRGGYCEALSNCNFKDGKCHFYKEGKVKKYE